MTAYSTITTEATLFDAEGHIQQNDVEISDHGDSIGINGTEHLKSDLDIGANKITSTLAGWELTW